MPPCVILWLRYPLANMTQYNCKRCGAELKAEPEVSEGDIVLRCLVCGAFNMVVAVLEIVGWRPS